MQPSNIFMSTDDLCAPKLGDMGEAKSLLGTSALRHTFAGTPVFMAPEMLVQDPHVGLAGTPPPPIQYTLPCDIWSLGATLYFLVTGGRRVYRESLAELRVLAQDPAAAAAWSPPALPVDVAAAHDPAAISLIWVRVDRHSLRRMSHCLVLFAGHAESKLRVETHSSCSSRVSAGKHLGEMSS